MAEFIGDFLEVLLRGVEAGFCGLWTVIVLFDCLAGYAAED